MNDLILLALEQEAPSLVDKPGVFFTGVGKVNAAITAAALIERYQPKRVFNFGTAGGITVEPGKLYQCTLFSQRDIMISGCVAGEQSHNAVAPVITGVGGQHLSTGDNFVTDPADAKGADLVDMEAYAIAKACYYAGVEFVCYKYVSDGADQTAADQFKQNVSLGEQLYLDALKSHGVKL
jgi:adenosylhomocysteine nucleosidase